MTRLARPPSGGAKPPHSNPGGPRRKTCVKGYVVAAERAARRPRRDRHGHPGPAMGKARIGSLEGNCASDKKKGASGRLEGPPRRPVISEIRRPVKTCPGGPGWSSWPDAQQSVSPDSILPPAGRAGWNELCAYKERRSCWRSGFFPRGEITWQERMQVSETDHEALRRRIWHSERMGKARIGSLDGERRI